MQNSNASNDREFLGITQNDTTLQGVVTGDPYISGDSFAFFNLKTINREQDPNGQWVDNSILVPVITMAPNQVSNVKNNIKDGRRLLIYTYYKPGAFTDSNGVSRAAFVIRQMKFGPKKWKPNTDSTPGLPVS